MHPYAIREEIIELTQQKLWPSYSTIHNALRALVAKGLVEESDSSMHWLKARRSVPYELTEKGRKLIEKDLDDYNYMVSMGRLWLKQSVKSPNMFGR